MYISFTYIKRHSFLAISIIGCLEASVSLHVLLVDAVDLSGCVSLPQHDGIGRARGCEQHHHHHHGDPEPRVGLVHLFNTGTTSQEGRGGRQL